MPVSATPKTRKSLASRTKPDKLSRMVRRASEREERFVVEGGGKPVIIMSLLDYIRSIAPTHPALRAIREEAERNGSSKLSMREIDAEIAAHRREARARAFAKTTAKNNGKKPAA